MTTNICNTDYNMSQVFCVAQSVGKHLNCGDSLISVYHDKVRFVCSLVFGLFCAALHSTEDYNMLLHILHLINKNIRKPGLIFLYRILVNQSNLYVLHITLLCNGILSISMKSLGSV